MTKKRAKPRPLQWLEDTSPEEIGEALLAVDEEKALRVVAYLVSRAGVEFERRVELVKDRYERDPTELFGAALLSGVRALVKR